MDYPVLTDLLSNDGRMARSLADFLSGAAAIEAHSAAGTIPSPVHKMAKGKLNRGLEHALSVIKQKYLWTNRNELSESVKLFEQKVDVTCLYMHLVKGKLAQARKNEIPHAYCQTLIALLAEVAPLAEKLVALKDHLEKRPMGKGQEKPKEGYVRPTISNATEERVVKLLEDATSAGYGQLKSMLIADYQRHLKSFMEGQSKKACSPWEFFCRSRPTTPDFEGFRAVDSIVEKVDGKYVSKTDADILIEAAVTKIADQYRTAFVHKNFRKIASIAESKGNLAHTETIRHTVNLRGMTGEFLFRFADGSHFLATNSVVFVINRYGTQFCRFPLRFSQVYLKDGKKLANPSEKLMNTEFVKA